MWRPTIAALACLFSATRAITAVSVGTPWSDDVCDAAAYKSSDAGEPSQAAVVDDACFVYEFHDEACVSREFVVNGPHERLEVELEFFQICGWDSPDHANVTVAGGTPYDVAENAGPCEPMNTNDDPEYAPLGLECPTQNCVRSVTLADVPAVAANEPFTVEFCGKQNHAREAFALRALTLYAKPAPTVVSVGTPWIDDVCDVVQYQSSNASQPSQAALVDGECFVYQFHELCVSREFVVDGPHEELQVELEFFELCVWDSTDRANVTVAGGTRFDVATLASECPPMDLTQGEYAPLNLPCPTKACVRSVTLADQPPVAANEPFTVEFCGKQNHAREAFALRGLTLSATAAGGAAANVDGDGNSSSDSEESSDTVLTVALVVALVALVVLLAVVWRQRQQLRKVAFVEKKPTKGVALASLAAQGQLQQGGRVDDKESSSDGDIADGDADPDVPAAHLV